MYEYMKGIITQIKPTHITLEVVGIGYHILMANPFRLSDKMQQKQTIYLYQSLAQDQIRLYGFINEQEKNLFMKLIGVSGIGPKSALSILALGDHIGLVNAIESADTKYLQKFPGVGKKTAAQIILDLQGKLAELSPELLKVFGDEQAAVEENIALDDAMAALEVLGYTKRDRKKAYQALRDLDDQSTDEYIRQALTLLMN